MLLGVAGRSLPSGDTGDQSQEISWSFVRVQTLQTFSGDIIYNVCIPEMKVFVQNSTVSTYCLTELATHTVYWLGGLWNVL